MSIRLLHLPGRSNANHSYQSDSYFGVISLFGTTIFTIVVNRCNQRDTQLAAEAEEAAEGDNEGGGVNRRLKIDLELQTILCAEYRYVRHQHFQPWHLTLIEACPRGRNAYFAVINLIGAGVFNFVGDRHHQRDGVLEAEAAKYDDIVERIRRAAD